MANWLERARREIPKTANRGTANTAERNLTSVTAVAQAGEAEISNASNRLSPAVGNGLPLTPKDKEHAQHLAVIGELPLRAWVVERVHDGEKLKAVKICSAPLKDHLWLVIDRGYQPSDGLAIYYPEELAELGTKTPEQLREIHKVKLVFPGCRVIQEGAER